MIEVVSGRLYFDYGIKGSPKDNKECHFFTTDNNADFHYEKFYKDFGPFNVAVLYKFCTLLHEKMKLVSLSKKRLIYYIASRDEEKRSNAAYLIGSFSILYLHMTCEGVCKLFCKREERPFLPFRDAAPGDSNYGLRLFDVFRAIEKANNLKWIDFENFDLNEYEFFEKVENGDLNWIIPRKILAFCGPHLRSTDEDGYPRHSPETYFDYFKKHNVTNIVRLNRKVYESSRFTEAGFRHDDLFFVDGSTPSNAIVLKFIKLIEDSSGAVAVHCKAGLGRTGTLIACYMMKHYGFTAPECMAWIRICRPGSIIGPQQQFLIHVQNWCRSLPGSNCRTQSPDNNTRLDKSHQVVSPDVLSQGVDRVRVTDNLTSVVGQKSLDNSGLQRQVPPVKKTSSSFYRSKTIRPYHQGEHLMRIKGSRNNQSCRNVKSKFKSDDSITTPQVNLKQGLEHIPETSRRKIPSKLSRTNLIKFADSAPKKSSSPSSTPKFISGDTDCDRSLTRKLMDRNNNTHKSAEKLNEPIISEFENDKSKSSCSMKNPKKNSSDSAERSAGRKIIVLLQGEKRKTHSCKEHQSVKCTSSMPFSFNKSRPGHYVKYSLRRLPIRLRASIEDTCAASGIPKTVTQQGRNLHYETTIPPLSKGRKSK